MDRSPDQQLLRDYADSCSESAFAELLRRHVDFVYSAALRMVRDAHLAEDVTQGVFMALAQDAGRLTTHPVLCGWLHRTAQNIAAQTVRTEVRRKAREQEAAMNEMLAPQMDVRWELVEPHLDAALGELNGLDRDALLLRFFERKSAREMAQILGVSDEAAQKRVTRALERLRELFARRGVTVGAGGLVVILSENIVHAAPGGLASSILSAATALEAAAAVTTATKVIAMTTLQKVFVSTLLTAAVGFGIYQAHEASALRARLQAAQQTLDGQNETLDSERLKASNQLAGLREENGRLNKNTAELLRLRNEVTQLRDKPAPLAAAAPEPAPDISPINTNSFQTFSSTNNFDVRWGQTMVVGGWKIPSGKTAFVFATPTRTSDQSQVAIQIKIAEASVPGPPLAGYTASGNQGTPIPGALSGILESDQYDTAMKALTQSGGFTMRDASVLVFSGQQAVMASGTTPEDTGSIMLLPKISADGERVELNIASTLNYPLVTEAK